MRLLALLLAAAFAVPTSTDLLDVTNAPIGAGLPGSWQTRAVKGFELPSVEVAAGDLDTRIVRISGAGRAGWLHRDLRRTPPLAGDSLRWSWRVLEAPALRDLMQKERDDAPIRLYVVFGNPQKLFGGSGRIIFYTFGNREPAGYERTSHVSSRMQIVTVDGARDIGAWRDHAVDPAADYQRIWGKTAPKVTAVGLMQDTDQTGERATAEVRSMSWGR